MDSFLGEVHGSRTLNTELNEDSEAQERSGEENDGELKEDLLSSETNETENKTSINSTFKLSSGNTQLNDNLKDIPEVKSAQRQVNDVFEMYEKIIACMKEKEDEYDLFGRMIAIKLKKIKNPDAREILMNDVNNLVFRKSMTERRLEKPKKQSVLSFWNKTDPFWSLVRTSVAQIFYYSLQTIKHLVQAEEDITT